MLQSMKLPHRRRTPRFGSPLGLRPARRNLPRSGLVFGRLTSPTPSLRERIRKYFKRRRFIFSWRKLLVFLGGSFLVFLILMSAVFAYYVRELPNPKKLTNRSIAQSTKIVDRNGKSLYNIHGEENRTIVKGDEISPQVKLATIATEDANFYNHYGFSLRGIGRVVLKKVGLLKNREGGGGSTITQQYIKNALLTQERSVDRKLKELILAIEIEQIYSKDEIITGYLNEIPYGSNAYGIEAAAQTYFNKSAKNLTLSEAATLVAIPQAPTYYSPYGNHLDQLFIRKDYILDRMVKVGFLSPEEAKNAKKEAPSSEQPNFQSQANLIAPHFVFYVREKLVEALGDDPQTAEQQLDQAGYTVVTSLDLEVQGLAQKILAEMGPDIVKRYQATNAAMTAVNPKNGEVLAMVGSIDYEKSKSGNTNFANANLQPGSSFKPIVYATAFGPEYKSSPASLTYDLPTDFGQYKPNNYDGKWRGPVTNRQALAGSLNIPAIKNLYLVGVRQAIDKAQDLGITTLNRPVGEYGLSLVLGSGEVKPIEMASAFGTFANEGIHYDLRPILEIKKGAEMIKDYKNDQGRKVLEPEVAYQINNILSDNNARSYIFGSNNNFVLPGRPAAVKSGTTENNRDAWTIGYTPSLAVSVWVGNNEPNKTMTRGADGSIVAAPIWNRFMREYFKGKPIEQFNRPATIRDLVIDKLSGKLPTDQTPDNTKVSDIFAPWQIPTEKDDVHLKVKIDKVTGKLATDLTPLDQIEERTFFLVHSEAPDKPGWENPVQEWARANGGGISPPTENDDVHTENNRPTVSFLTPVDGAVVSGEMTIEAVPGGSQAITKLEYFLGNVSIGSKTAAPWSITYNASSLSGGSYTIEAIVTNELGLTRSAQVTVSTNQDTSPPGTVSNLSITDGSKVLAKPIIISWTNPSNSDLVAVNIYQSMTSDPIDLGVKIKSVSVTPNGNSTAEIDVSGLTVGKTYYFILRPVDARGNENQNSKKISAKVLP